MIPEFEIKTYLSKKIEKLNEVLTINQCRKIDHRYSFNLDPAKRK